MNISANTLIMSVALELVIVVSKVSASSRTAAPPPIGIEQVCIEGRAIEGYGS